MMATGSRLEIYVDESLVLSTTENSLSDNARSAVSFVAQ